MSSFTTRNRLAVGATTLIAAVAIFSCLTIGAGSSFAQCGPSYGDISGEEEGVVNVVDTTCAMAVILSSLQSAPTEDTSCLKVDEPAVDLNGDNVLSIVDCLISISLALEVPLPAAIDADGSGCPDAFEVECGDDVCSDTLGESCLTCPFDCGDCDNLCCVAHAAPGCVEPEVEACVCEISSFCCDFLWDQSCADLAIDFCDPNCEPPPCPTSGTLKCGQTVVGNTVGGSEHFESYACAAGTFGSPERIYQLTLDDAPGVQINLTPAEGADLTVAILGNSCDSATQCFTSGKTTVQTPIGEGETVYVVVDAPAGSGGSYELNVTCADECDIDALCGEQECGSVQCAGLSFPCGACEAGFACTAGVCTEITVPGCPGTGSCTEANDTIGCEDAACCAEVCSADPFCCDTSWDATCADGALEVCFDECGNGACQPELDENCATCPSDCGCLSTETCSAGLCIPCGDGVCDPALGENCDTCAADCACNSGFACEAGSCNECDFDALCAGGGCGTVTCGGITAPCAPCPEGQYCQDGISCAILPANPTCVSAAGDCLTANGSVGCDDEQCCNIVCADDPFCCSNSWDTICSGSAATDCPTSTPGVCEPLLGENCTNSPEDCPCPEGQTCIDGFCADGAACPAPAPIACGETITIDDLTGATNQMANYGCTGEVLSGPELAFSFTTPEGIGQVSFELAPDEGVDATLLWLGPNCASDSCLDSPENPTNVSVNFEDLYHVVVDSAGEGGGFALTATCTEACDPAIACPIYACGVVPCTDGVGTVDCGECAGGIPCTEDNVCFDLNPGCPAFGDCLEASESPGCMNAACCTEVCQSNPFCCDTAWDGTCAFDASQACADDCGNGSCQVDNGENCENCPFDCGCLDSETCATGGICVPCGDGVCDPTEGENCETCALDCACDTGFECTAGSCDECDFDALCAGGGCGLVTCGGITQPCEACPEGQYCQNGATCATLPSNGSCPGAGDCEVSNGSVGCDDELCCNIVCADDGFCCTSSWDGICAASAATDCPKDQIGVCEPNFGENCSTKPGDCPCPEGTICQDGSCTDAAACPAPAAIACGETVTVTAEDIGGATNSMAAYSCSDLSFPGSELAYAFTTPEGVGSVVFELTPEPGVDATLLMTGETCSSDSCDGLPISPKTVAVAAGEVIHAIVDSETTNGAFTLTATCTEACDPALVCSELSCGEVPCSDGVGVVDCGNCPDGLPCNDNLCFEAVLGCPGTGDCFVENETIGCSDALCCSIVCADDPFCCDTSWDDLCAETAFELCP